MTHTTIKEACESVIRHIYCVSGRRVQCITLHWKVDRKDRLQLLYCSQLRLQKRLEPGRLPVKAHAIPEPHNRRGLRTGCDMNVDMMWADLRAVQRDSAAERSLRLGDLSVSAKDNGLRYFWPLFSALSLAVEGVWRREVCGPRAGGGVGGGKSKEVAHCRVFWGAGKFKLRLQHRNSSIQ